MQNRRGNGSGLFGIVIAVFVAAGLWTSPAVAQDDPAPALFKDVAGVDGVSNNDVGALRSRTVSIEKQFLTPLKKGDRLTLNFFNDVALTAVIDNVRTSAAQTHHWQGHIEGNPYSSVLMVMHNGAVAGIIRVPSVGDFRIRSFRNRGQIVEELDPMKFPPCGTGPAQVKQFPPGQANAGGVDGPAPPSPCVRIIDVMIVYTPEARDLEGGTDQVQAIAILAVDETNSVFANSLIDPRVRLVYVGEVEYIESGSFSTELQRLADPADGIMDEVHALRATYGADAVDLLISHTQGETICGIAYLMNPVSPLFESEAFSVCNTGCTSGGVTFPHELGHNMGCQHDRQTVANQGNGPGVFSYSYGYRFAGDDLAVYRTVMAYEPGERIPYFSNPAINYQNQPIGLPEGHTDINGNPDSADNARTINETAPIVSEFRPTAPSTGGGTSPLSWPTPSIIQPVDLLAGDHFGWSVAMDGDLAIIGAPDDDGKVLLNTGAAYVYRRSPETKTWELLYKLFADDGMTNDRFGYAVDIRDGPEGFALAAVGAYQTDDGGRDSGAAYVFRLGPTSASQEPKLLADDKMPNDQFGRAVALARGTTEELVLIGAYLDDFPTTNSGSVYLFRNTVGGWTQDSHFKAKDTLPDDQFGVSLALSIDPATQEPVALIGAWMDDHNFTFNAGSAYVFRYTELGWMESAKLIAPFPELGDQLGLSVSLDASTGTLAALVGAWMTDTAATNTGVAYVFRQTGKDWVLDGRLTAADPQANARLGVSVSLYGDRALVGAHLHDASMLLVNTGAAYVFHKHGLGWIQEAKITAPQQELQDQFGFSVALRENRAFIGAIQREFDVQTDAGAVYITEGVAVTDCNKNGVLDQCDIEFATSLDANGNGVPDECDPVSCPGDLAPSGSPDGLVNVSDLLAVINAWGPCPVPPATCPADIAPSGAPDGLVNVSDLLAIINAWGPCAP